MFKKVVDYKLVSIAPTSETGYLNIQSYLAEGWELYGCPFPYTPSKWKGQIQEVHCVVQAMILYEKGKIWNVKNLFRRFIYDNNN